jgi:hypothetical protein
MTQSQVSGIRSPKSIIGLPIWRPGGKGEPNKKKMRANLEGANYMFGCDGLLRILFTDLVRFRGNEMYEF